MLGEPFADEQRRERFEFYWHLFNSPWTDPASRAHQGYLTDHWKYLIESEQPPPSTGSLWREVERLTWWTWRIFRGLQRQRARLAGSAA